MQEIESTDTLRAIEWLRSRLQPRRAKIAVRVAAVGACLFFLATAFHSGWTRVETDFPNYYTAAVAARQGLPMRNNYDWTAFQRQMNFAGIERQLGGYQINTPLTALPMIPLAGLQFQTAKRVWLVLNLGFLGGTLWLLARITLLRLEHLVLLTFLGFGSLYSNFLYGQYYVFLLFLLTLAFYFLRKDQPVLSGCICGIAFGLKLYSGPLLLYFIAKRQWRAVAGFLAAAVGGALLAIAMFGWADVHYYATQILPRALEGDVVDPFSPGNGTFSALLRRMVVMEPELNPQPLWNAPAVFFFLRPLVTVLLAGFAVAGVAMKKDGEKDSDFAWFMILILLLSTSTSSYTFILLLLPVVLLLQRAEPTERVVLVAAFAALNFPLLPSWVWAFPRLWMLAALFILVGWEYLRAITPRVAMAIAAVAVAFASIDAYRQTASYAAEPGRRYERVATEASDIFSSSPVVTRAGLFYQAIGRNGHVLHWLHDGRIEELAFEGHAFRPAAASPDGPILFELVAKGKSKIMAFDPITRTLAADERKLPDKAEPVISPDGKWLAVETMKGGTDHILLHERTTGRSEVLTGGKCNSFSPTWELDSGAIIFASDCDRSVGLPALYRAEISSTAFAK